MELLLAATNLHLLRDIRSILRSSYKNFDILSASPFSCTENAQSSTEDYARLNSKKNQKWTLAVSAALVIPELTSTPIIEVESTKALALEIASLKEEKRSAYLEIYASLCRPNGELEESVRAFSEGRVAQEVRGSQGFGFDLLFIKEGYDKTLAQLSEEVKNKVSPLRKALDKLGTLFNRL